MKVENNYIFLTNSEEKKVIKSKNNNSSNKCVIYVPLSIRQRLNKCFNFIDEEWISIVPYFRFMASKKTIINNISSTITFEVFNVQKHHYLNIEVECSTRSNCIKVMEYINDQLNHVPNGFEDGYSLIIAYDAVSDFYCNKIFIKFSHFERLFRRLLYNIYILNYGNDYFTKTINKEIIDKVKGNIRPKKNKEEQYLKEFFYSLDYGDLQSVLFTKKWTAIEQANKDDFLSKNTDLSRLSDNELRIFINSIETKSDWERLFDEKVKVSGIADKIDYIRKQRNKVAHSKFFTKDDYSDSLKTLTPLVRSVNKAIIFTQDKDFQEKNQLLFSKSLRDIATYFENMQNTLTSTLYPALALYVEKVRPISDAIGNLSKSMLPIYETLGKFSISLKDFNQDDVDEDQNNSSDENKETSGD